LHQWGLTALAENAEIIVAELVANAVVHAVEQERQHRRPPETMGLRLLRRTREAICAVLDPSDALPVLKPHSGANEGGHGLQIVDELSDVWGWGPVAGRGKEVWAVLFCTERSGQNQNWSWRLEKKS
jgi:hypothetical protein